MGRKERKEGGSEERKERRRVMRVYIPISLKFTNILLA